MPRVSNKTYALSLLCLLPLLSSRGSFPLKIFCSFSPALCPKSQFIELLPILWKKNSGFSTKLSPFSFIIICYLCYKYYKTLEGSRSIREANTSSSTLNYFLIASRHSINYNLLILVSSVLVSFFPNTLIRGYWHIFWKKCFEWYIGFTLVSKELEVTKKGMVGEQHVLIE